MPSNLPSLCPPGSRPTVFLVIELNEDYYYYYYSSRCMQFNFDLPSTILKRSDVFARKYRMCSNVVSALVVNIACLLFLLVCFHYLLALSDDE